MAQLEVTRQGSVKPFTIVDGPYAWTAADYKDNKSYITLLNEADLAELEAAVEAALQKRSDIKDIKLGDFELPTLAERLIAIREEVRAGRGFAIIKGVPVDRWSRQVVAAAYWIMGLHWGNAKSNNKQGHLIGHIKDIGHDPSNPNTRLYATNAAQPWHNDSADIVTLLCLRNAKEGGHSGWSSSISVHNEILRRAPELAQLLAGPWWYYDRKGEVPAGKLPYFLIPVFNYHQGYLSVNFSSNYYYLSQRHPEVPRLGPDHLAAIKLFEELAAGPELAMHAVLEPGDIQVLNNHTCLHHRTAFVDHEDPAERRHLLRLWLAPENDRPLPEVYSEIYGGSVEPGQRGGIRIEGHQEHITLEAE